MVCELEKISVRDTVLRDWASGDARPSSVGRKLWCAGRGSSVGRCVRLALGVGAGLGLLVNCMVVSAILLPLHLMVLPALAAVVAVGLAVNVGVGGAGSASAPASGPPELLELSRPSGRDR